MELLALPRAARGLQVFHTAGLANPCQGRESGRGPRHTKLSDSSAGQKAAFQNIAQNKAKKMCCLKELPAEQVEASLKH